MLAALRSAVPAKSPARHTLINLYTTVASLTRKQWKTGAHPAPNSLAESKDEDEEDWPQPLTEEHTPLQAADDADADADESSRPLSHRPHPVKPEFHPTPHEFRAYRETMKRKFPDGWAPPRKISREAMISLRHLHQMDPEMFSTPALADRFRISKEAVRRILKGKWEPTREERARLAERERLARARFREEKRSEEMRKYESIEKENGRERMPRDEFTLT